MAKGAGGEANGPVARTVGRALDTKVTGVAVLSAQVWAETKSVCSSVRPSSALSSTAPTPMISTLVPSIRTRCDPVGSGSASGREMGHLVDRCIDDGRRAMCLPEASRYGDAPHNDEAFQTTFVNGPDGADEPRPMTGPCSTTSEPDVMPDTPSLEDLATATLVLGQIERDRNKWRRRPPFDHGNHVVLVALSD
jgi:hypothetical protein